MTASLKWLASFVKRYLARQVNYAGAMDESRSPQRRYEQVAASLREAIKDGTYPVGDRLPSIQQLQAEFGISHMTVKAALNVLREDGLIASRAGVPAQVVALPGDQAPPVQTQINELRSVVEDLAARLESVEAHAVKSRPTEGV